MRLTLSLVITMKKLLVTLNINDHDKEITELTFPYMREYAKNVGADFHIIKDRKFLNYPVMLEKFQIYEISKDYDWIIYLDADCLINPNGVDLTSLVEEDRVLIAKYTSPTHHFYPENIEGKYNLSYYAPFFFLVFHNKNRDCVKPYKNAKQYRDYINLNSSHPEMIQYMKTKSDIIDGDIKISMLDEFFLTLNLHKYNIMTASLQEDFLRLSIIAHISDSKENKIKFLKNSIKQVKSINSISYT